MADKENDPTLPDIAFQLDDSVGQGFPMPSVDPFASPQTTRRLITVQMPELPGLDPDLTLAPPVIEVTVSTSDAELSINAEVTGSVRNQHEYDAIITLLQRMV